MSFVCPSTYAFNDASKTQFIFITTICSESVVELERFVQDLKDNFRLGIQKYRVQKLIFDLGFKSLGFKSPEFKSLEFKSSYLAWGSKVRSSKVTGSKVQSSKVWGSKVPFNLGVQRSGFKSESSNVRGSNVPESKSRSIKHRVWYNEHYLRALKSTYKLMTPC